jgi:hypothetical protein
MAQLSLFFVTLSVEFVVFLSRTSSGAKVQRKATDIVTEKQTRITSALGDIWIYMGLAGPKNA